MTPEEKQNTLKEYKNALTDAHNINLELLDAGARPNVFMYIALLLKSHHLNTGEIIDFSEEYQRIESLK